MLNATDTWCCRGVVEKLKQRKLLRLFWLFNNYKNERFQYEKKILADANSPLFIVKTANHQCSVSKSCMCALHDFASIF